MSFVTPSFAVEVVIKGTFGKLMRILKILKRFWQRNFHLSLPNFFCSVFQTKQAWPTNGPNYFFFFFIKNIIVCSISISCCMQYLRSILDFFPSNGFVTD